MIDRERDRRVGPEIDGLRLAKPKSPTKHDQIEESREEDRISDDREDEVSARDMPNPLFGCVGRS